MRGAGVATTNPCDDLVQELSEYGGEALKLMSRVLPVAA